MRYKIEEVYGCYKLGYHVARLTYILFMDFRSHYGIGNDNPKNHSSLDETYSEQPLYRRCAFYQMPTLPDFSTWIFNNNYKLVQVLTSFEFEEGEEKNVS